MGITLATLNWFETVPVEKERLKIFSRGLDTNLCKSLRNFVGILKGPLALVTLSSHISSEISFDVVGDKEQLFVCHSGRYISGDILLL